MQDKHSHRLRASCRLDLYPVYQVLSYRLCAPDTLDLRVGVDLHVVTARTENNSRPSIGQAYDHDWLPVKQEGLLLYGEKQFLGLLWSDPPLLFFILTHWYSFLHPKGSSMIAYPFGLSLYKRLSTPALPVI